LKVSNFDIAPIRFPTQTKTINHLIIPRPYKARRGAWRGVVKTRKKAENPRFGLLRTLLPARQAIGA